MKNTSFKLKIETPCHENWQKMNTNRDGKFCDACQKNVVDFTNKTPREIALALNNSSEKMCGRFTTTQLAQVYSVVDPPKIETNWYKNIAASFLVMLGVKSASAQDTIPKTQSNFVEGNSSMIIGDTIVVEQKIAQEKLIIIGHLIDQETKEPIPFVKIYLGDKVTAAISDFDGKFIMNFDSRNLKDTIIITYEMNQEYQKLIQYYTVKDFNDKGVLELKVSLTPINVMQIDGMIVIDRQTEKKRNR